MMPSGSPAPIGGSQSVSPALLRSNAAILGSQGGLLPLQPAYPSLAPPRAQYNLTLLGNSPNISSLLNQTFASMGPNASISGLGGFQRGGIDTTAESDSFFNVAANDIGFSSSPSLFALSNSANSGSSDQIQNSQISNPSGNPMFSEQQQSQVQKFESQKFQHGHQSMQQPSVSHSQQQQHQLQQQLQSVQNGLGGVRTVKLEPQTMNDQIGPQQQLQSMQNLGPVKLEPQQNQMGRRMRPVKLEDQHSDQAMLLQQQHQHFLQMSRQSSQAAVALAQMKFLQQQRILQLQQAQQNQQLLKALPQQRPELQQQFQQQNLPIRPAVRPAYEPGTCARRLTQFMYQQEHRPEDNNIEFWRKFVAEFFAPNAKKKWCVSLYGNSRQTNGVFPQDVWHCEICNCKPGRGFESTVEVLPRLFKIKYDSGTLQELLYVDMPREYENASGQIVLDYAKAIQESVFEHLHVVRDGQLRLVFSPDLKICSWEFCARQHEELIPRRLIIPQVSQLGTAAQRYQVSAQNASSNSSAQDLQSNCNMFVASARQLAKALEVPLVNDLGYSKRYVRCLQIAEVVNSMKDLIDYSRETGKGPMESLASFPCRTSLQSGLHNSAQQPEGRQQQITGQNLINDHNSVQASASNCVASVNNSQSTTSTSNSATTVVELLCENSMNSRHENQTNNPSSPYGGTPVQIPSAGSSTTLPPAQLNPSSPFSPTPSSSNNPHQTSHNALTASTTRNHISSANSLAQIPLQPSSLSNEDNLKESQSSVDKIIQEIMNSSQFTGEGSMVSAGSLGSNMNHVNRLNNSLTSGNCFAGNGIVISNSGVPCGGFGNLGGGVGLSTAASGIRPTIWNNSGALTGRVGLPLLSQDSSMNLQQQDLANRLLNGLGENGFNSPQFDWKYP